jgi:uncharacterized protein involved in outer membrane biogenesis
MANETQTGSRPPRRWLRRIGYLFGGIILLLVVVYFVGTSSWALKSIILPKVSAAMNAKVTVDDASISPFSAVTLSGLKVETTGTEPLVSAKEVRLRYSLMDIIKGNINVSEVTFESPVVNLVTTADGKSNLDPITKGSEQKPTKETKPEEKKSGEAPQVNLKKFALNNATVRKTDLRVDGTKQVVELTGVNITADDIGNGKVGQFGLAANIRMDQGLNSSSNGVLAASVGGKFNLQLDAALKPQVLKGQTKVDVSEGKGAFAQAAGMSVTLNTDLTPTQLNDVSVRVAQNGKNLTALVVSGPFNAETMEGKLAVVLSGVDRQVLSIVGGPLGMDFNQTAISSTNTIELTQKGKMVTVNGALFVGNFSVTKQGQTTPTVDVRSSYAVVYDELKQTALVQTFALNGTQNSVEFLRGSLAKPMRLDLGAASGAVDESAFNLVVTNFNLPDWRAFFGTNVALSSGRAGVNLNLLSHQAGKELLIAGTVNLDDLTGTMDANRFDRFATALDVDVALRGQDLEIKKLSGALRQSGQAGGSFDVAGRLHLTNQVGTITATLTDLNQHALKSFLAAALGDKQLESITINSKTTAKLDGADKVAVQTEFHVANLVVNDPSGQVPRTPLAVDITADVAKAGQAVDLRAVQLALTKTERAPNTLNVAGRVDMTKSNAWTGNVKITSDGLDVTPYYDLFADKKPKTETTTSSRPVPPTETKPETEPEPMTLPFSQFTAEMSIAKFFLREVAISNLVSKTVIEGARVKADPFSLTLNGAPVNFSAFVNLAVAGYEYDMNAKLAGVPVEPLVNSFAPEKRGQMKGDLFTSAQIKGAGVTGPNLKKNLGGQIGLTLTNANVQVTQYKSLTQILTPIAIALRIPQLSESPLNWIDAQATISNGTVHLPGAIAESSVFRGGMSGTVTMDEVLTNSVLNNLPVDIALRRNVSDAARMTPSGTPADVQFVTLPRFVSVAGTAGNPKTKIDTIAVTRLLAGTVGNYLGGDAGKILKGIGNLGTGSSTNASGTNTTSTNAVGNLIQGLGSLLQKPAKTNATTTNAPSKKGGFKLNDLIK